MSRVDFGKSKEARNYSDTEQCVVYLEQRRKLVKKDREVFDGLILSLAEKGAVNFNHSRVKRYLAEFVHDDIPKHETIKKALDVGFIAFAEGREYLPSQQMLLTLYKNSRFLEIIEEHFDIFDTLMSAERDNFPLKFWNWLIQQRRESGSALLDGNVDRFFLTCVLYLLCTTQFDEKTRPFDFVNCKKNVALEDAIQEVVLEKPEVIQVKFNGQTLLDLYKKANTKASKKVIALLDSLGEESQKNKREKDMQEAFIDTLRTNDDEKVVMYLRNGIDPRKACGNSSNALEYYLNTHKNPYVDESEIKASIVTALTDKITKLDLNIARRREMVTGPMQPFLLGDLSLSDPKGVFRKVSGKTASNLNKYYGFGFFKDNAQLTATHNAAKEIIDYVTKLPEEEFNYDNIIRHLYETITKYSKDLSPEFRKAAKAINESLMGEYKLRSAVVANSNQKSGGGNSDNSSTSKTKPVREAVLIDLSDEQEECENTNNHNGMRKK